jgi:uncharacterized protein (DUF1778 family)
MLPQKNQEAITISIRAKTKQRDLIDQAAECQGRSRSDFMLAASCREAEDILLDKAFFTVDKEAFKNLQSLLINPLPPTDKLRRLMATKAPWDIK